MTPANASDFKRRIEVSVPTFSLAPRLVVGTERVTTMVRLGFQRPPFRLVYTASTNISVVHKPASPR
jgi:hypothetical protein